MAKQSGKKRQSNFKNEGPGKNSRPEKNKVLEPGTGRGIVIVILFLLAVVSLLSIWGLAGSVGEYLARVLTFGFGWERFLIPFILVIVGYFLIRPEKLSLKASNYIGLVLFILSLAGVFHFFVSGEGAKESVAGGQGGGYLGYAVSYFLIQIMGKAASAAVLIAIFVISLLLFFSTSLNKIIERGGSVLLLVRRFNNWRFKRGVEKMNHEEDNASQSTAEATVEIRDLKDGEKTKESSGMQEQFKLFPLNDRKKKIDLPLDLLETSDEKPTSGDIQLTREMIKKTLKNFGIDVEMFDVCVGPTVTQYTLKPAEGIKLAQITTLQNDLALALAAHPIRIEAPIPGKSLVGIEIPNKSVAVVKLKDVLVSEGFKNRKSNLYIGLGKDVAGRPVTADLDPMPHLLIAGATGSGKSVCINSIILSLLYQNSPDDLKFILVDPKRVEMTSYDGIPHLLTPVITEVNKTINALKWIVREMDRRYNLLSEHGRKDIHSFNGTNSERLPYIILIIDELADLMSVAVQEVEGAILRLAQMSRAVGIHLVVATQRPSVDVITGLIKANITSRVAFNVASIADSRTILDFSGAEKLLGRGDMLYVSAAMSRPRRIQGAFLSEKEIRRVTDFLKQKSRPEYQGEVTERYQSTPQETGGYSEEEDEELLAEAKEVIVRAKKASASLLQRRLRIGYARAARVLDILEGRGIIGPADGARPREVLDSNENKEEGEPKDMAGKEEI